MNLDDARNVTNQEISAELKLPPVKRHCSMLAEDAINAAIQDIENKRAGTGKYAAATPNDTIIAH